MGADAIEIVRTLTPDIAVLDVTMGLFTMALTV